MLTFYKSEAFSVTAQYAADVPIPDKKIGVFDISKIYHSFLYISLFLAVLRSHETLVRIRIRGSIPLTNGFGSADPDPAIFVSDLQDVNRRLISFIA
jgi:hypothetical protein